MRLGSYSIYRFPRTKSEIQETRSRLLKFLQDHCVIRSRQEPLYSPKGKSIGWLIDVRRALLDPQAMPLVAALFWDQMSARLPFQLVCTEIAGIPLLSALQSFGSVLGHSVNGVIVRKERKTYGRQRQFEGELTDAPIVFVDDVLNSGSSVNRAAVVLGEQNRGIDHIFTLITFNRKATFEKWTEAGASLNAVYSLDEFNLDVSEQETPLQWDIFSLKWKFRSEGASLRDVVPKSSPVVDDERIYFGTDSGIFYALNQSDGSVAWSHRVVLKNRKGIWSSPTLMGDKVIFGAYDGCVYALDTKTGKVVWRFHQADWVGSSPCFSLERNLVYVGLEHALVPASKGSVIALNGATGEVAWEYRTLRYVHASPLYIAKHGLVAIGDNGGDFNGFDADSGELKWRFIAPDSIKSRPAFDAQTNNIVFGCFDGGVYAVDAGSGKSAWSFQTNGLIYSEPLILNGRVYVCSSDKSVYVLDAATGERLDSVTTRGKTFGCPAAIGEHVYFGSTDGVVYEYDVAKAKLVGQHQLPEKITNRISYSAARNLFIVSTYDNQVFGLVHK
jgi:outer membrane protein assembly factor BamB